VNLGKTEFPQGVYGHEKADDMTAAAAYIAGAFKKILGW